jgi:hypothetical protein
MRRQFAITTTLRMGEREDSISLRPRKDPSIRASNRPLACGRWTPAGSKPERCFLDRERVAQLRFRK